MKLHFTNLSIIIPLYNYLEINDNINYLVTIFSKNSYDFKIIIIDDGSTKTNDLDRNSKYFNKLVFYKKLDKNYGKGNAIIEAIKVSNCNHVLFTDCDFAYPVEQVLNFYKYFVNNSNSILIANRRSNKSTVELSPKYIKYIFQRELLGIIFNKLLKLLKLTKFDDTQAGLKAFPMKAYLEIDEIETSNFLFDVELLYKFEKSNFKINSLPVKYQYKDSQTSVKLIKQSFSIIFSLITLYFKLNKIK